MDCITLSKSDLTVSRLGFGCDPMGGHCWGRVNTDDVIQAIHLALDNNVNLFDTADVYGLGQSEQILGAALKGRRNKAVIATKFGVRIANGKTFYDNNPQWIEKALLGSLERLNTDYIDLYQIHYRDSVTPLINIIEVLEKKSKEGTIRYYGFSNVSSNDLKELCDENLPEGLISFQNEYSIVSRSKEEEIKKIIQNYNLDLLTWGSLGQGILSGKYNNKSTFIDDDRRLRPTYVNFHGEKLIKNMKIIDKVKEMSIKYNKPLTAIAIRWILDYLGASVVLTGVKNSQQLIQNMEALGWYLQKTDIEELDLISS